MFDAAVELCEALDDRRLPCDRTGRLAREFAERFPCEFGDEQAPGRGDDSAATDAAGQHGETDGERSGELGERPGVGSVQLRRRDLAGIGKSSQQRDRTFELRPERREERDHGKARLEQASGQAGVLESVRARAERNRRPSFAGHRRERSRSAGRTQHGGSTRPAAFLVMRPNGSNGGCDQFVGCAARHDGACVAPARLGPGEGGQRGAGRRQDGIGEDDGEM